MYYLIRNRKIEEVSEEACYPPNENNEIMVHDGPYGYSFYKLNEKIFKTKKKAEQKLKAKR